MASVRAIKEAAGSPLFLFAAFFSFHVLLPSHAVDTIRSGDTLGVNQTLVSAGGIFELGFFTDSFTGNYFLGIWVRDDPRKKAVWIANRDNPIYDLSGFLQMRSDGNLILLDRRQTPFMVNAGSVATSGNTSATLLDSGNLVLKQGDQTVWQSIDDPTDTYLPGMKLGWFGLNTNQPRPRVLVSWVSPQSPARGPFTLGVDNSSSTRLSVWRGDSAHMDIGIWEGTNFRFTFNNGSGSNDQYNFRYVSTKNETYFTFSGRANGSVLVWFAVNSVGQFDEYALSSNGRISSKSHAICEEDSRGSKRCLTSMPSKCKDGAEFSQVNGTIPTSLLVGGSINTGFRDCEIMCRSNCSCAAFASLQQGGQTGCQLYYGNKEDLLKIIDKGSVEMIYLRGNVPENAGKSEYKRIL